MKTHIFTLATFSLLFLLSACGGGSSSGGPTVIVVNDGVYEGVQNWDRTVEGDEQFGDVISFDFIMTVFENEVTIFNSSFSVSASISGNTFVTTPGEFEFQTDDLNCAASVFYTGNISGGFTSGTVEGVYICVALDDPDFVFRLIVDGNFDGTRDPATTLKEPLFPIQENSIEAVFRVISN